MASTSTSSHLSYPAPEAPEGSTSTLRASSPPLPELLKNRLYVGNLHPTVDEFVPLYILTGVEPLNRPRYTLIQVFSKFGKLARLDYLFHKTGALRGKPRGYAFVEYTGEGVSALGSTLSFPLHEISCVIIKCSTRVFSPLARRSAPPVRRPRFPYLLRSALLRPGLSSSRSPPARCTNCTSKRWRLWTH